MQTLFKDPVAVLDYGFDWSDWLVTDTITSSSWIVPTGLTLDSDSNDTTSTTVWLSGGTAKKKYIVTNTVDTAGGRTEDRSFEIECTER